MIPTAADRAVSDAIEDEMLDNDRIAFDSHLSPVHPLPDDEQMTELASLQTEQAFRQMFEPERASARQMLDGLVMDLKSQGLLAPNVSIRFTDREIDQVTEALIGDEIDGAHSG